MKMIINSNNKFKETKKHKTKKHKTKTSKTKISKTDTNIKLNGGADFFKGLIKTGQKNYSVPGEKYIHSFNPNKYLSKVKNNSKSNTNRKQLEIIFNRNGSNKIDITNEPNNTILYSNVVINEPYLYIESMGKYLIVMYREVLINFEKKKLLYWLMGYINYNIKKIFNYISPNVPVGTTADFTIRIYKLPKNYIDINNVKIDTIVNHNDVYNQQKLIKAYNVLFDTYLKPYKLLPATNINFKVKGSSNQMIDILNIVDKNQQQTKMAKYSH
jgi:hypothetical protein